MAERSSPSRRKPWRKTRNGLLIRLPRGPGGAEGREYLHISARKVDGNLILLRVKRMVAEGKRGEATRSYTFSRQTLWLRPRDFADIVDEIRRMMDEVRQQWPSR